MPRAPFLFLGGFVIAVTLLPLLRSKVWWIRIWDFPRFQIAMAGVIALAGTTLAGGEGDDPWFFSGLLGAARTSARTASRR